MIESDKDRFDRMDEEIFRLRRSVEHWKTRALEAEAEAKERRCAMDFAASISCNRLPHNAGNQPSARSDDRLD